MSNWRDVLAPILHEAISRRVTPGAVVLVRDGDTTVCHQAFGTTADAGDGGTSVQLNTIYDAASVTKAAVTSTLLMNLVGSGVLSLESPVRPWLPELNGPKTEGILLKHLLGHSSGLPAHQLFYQRIWSGDRISAGGAWETLVSMAAQTPLAYKTGEQTLYSDLGYILLACLLERITDTPLDQLFSERIARPLGMTDSRFVNLAQGAVHPHLARVAPTGASPDDDPDSQQQLHGRVHDDNCRSGGGVSGHAGLFTTAHDLAILGQALCDSYRQTGQQPSFIPTDVVRQFWRTAAAPSTSWRMGWDTPSAIPGVSHTGEAWPQTGVGHLGFTGTCLWLAPEHNRLVVILTNRVYYSWEKTGIKSLRRALFDAIGRNLALE